MKINNGIDADKHSNIGTFTVSSGAIVVSDPCYKYETWCAGLFPAVNGLYNARVGLYKDQFDINHKLERIYSSKAAIHLIDTYGYYESQLIGRKVVKHTKFSDYNIESDTTLNNIQINIINDLKQRATDTFSGNDPIESYKFCNTYEKVEDYTESYIYDAFDYVVYTDRKLSRDVSFDMYMHMSSIDKQYEYDDPQRYIEHGKLAVKYLNENIQYYIDELNDKLNMRVAYLQFSLKDFTPLNSDKWENSEHGIGVDSGQAGIYDHDWYKYYNGTCRRDLDDVEDEIDDENEIDADGNIVIKFGDEKPLKGDPNKIYYEEICNLTENMRYDKEYNIIKRVAAGTFMHGAVSSTAWGDGGYSFYYIKDEAGNIVEGLIHYYEEYDEDEEDDN